VDSPAAQGFRETLKRLGGPTQNGTKFAGAGGKASFGSLSGGIYACIRRYVRISLSSAATRDIRIKAIAENLPDGLQYCHGTMVCAQALTQGT
jgi:hypothetical protein